jgi:hypothetical protein
MRRYMATAPPWVLAALYAVNYFVWMIVPGLGPHDWMNSLPGALVGAVVIASIMWLVLRSDAWRTSWIFGGMTRDQEWEVRRAAGKGVPPDDPALQPAALALARYQLTEHEGSRIAAIGLAAVLSAGSVGLAINDRSPWYAIGPVIFGAFLVGALRYPSRQRRRIARLEAATDR